MASTILVKSEDGGQNVFTILPAGLQTYSAVLLFVIQLLYPRRPDLYTPCGEAVDLERSSSALKRYSMYWCTTALEIASDPLTLDKLPIIDHCSRSKSQSLLLAASGTTLWDNILAERYLGFARQWTLMLVRTIVTFGSPYCVMRLLGTLEDNNGRTDDAWIWLLGISVSSLLQTIINHHLIWIQWSEMGIPIRAQLIMSIFQKALRRKDSKDQKKTSDFKLSSKNASNRPEAINLISSDTMAFSMFTAVNYIIPASLLRFFFTIIFLLKLLGWKSTIVGVLITVICVPVHTFIIKQQRAAQNNLTAARDKKMKAVIEALHALRQIKFSALETQWEDHINKYRQEEIEDMRWSFMVSNTRAGWGVIAPFIVAAALIMTYRFFQGSITPSIIFPMIEILPHLQENLGFVPVVFQDYFGARMNARRMDEFLRRPEQRKILGSSPSGCISFQDVSITWPVDEFGIEKEQSIPDHQFYLHSINLQFPAGEMSIVSGATGSGKSLLLAAIIGEVELLSGHINAPSMADGHPVAFVSQTPWLQNGTIKDNILFGSLFDQKRYESVLTACALHPDLSALPNRDETQIGLRGVKLSGGQRARVAFGRALYSQAQLLVIDDIFSALDSHVSKHISDALTGELVKGRTRVLVTHMVTLCLPKARYVVHIKNNTIEYAGTVDSISHQLKEVGSEVPPSFTTVTAETPATHTQSKMVFKKPELEKAKRLSSQFDLDVYIGYFAAAGGLSFTCIYLTGLVTRQLISALTKWLLGSINSVHDKNSPIPIHVGAEQQKYLYFYFCSSLISIVLESLLNLYTSSGSIQASKTLFHQVTSRVIRQPILWLDTTPIGEVLRVFTVQMRMVDDNVLATMSAFADCLVKLMTVVGVGLVPQ